MTGQGMGRLPALAVCALLAALLAPVGWADSTMFTSPAPAPVHGPDHDGHDHEGHDHAGHGHEGGEGLKLIASAADQLPTSGASCPKGAPVRPYDVVAISVDITLNQYLDHDPQGRMYALEEDLPAVAAEQARNRGAREAGGQPAVSVGLQGDAIQPLTLRVTQGECLRLAVRNALPAGESVSLHLHGASLVVAGTGGPAIATNPDAMAPAGRTVTYEWMVEPSEPEATHYFHSHGDQRPQTNHGLFGAVVVEPAGSTWLDPRTGTPLRTGWDAVVRSPSQPPFREYVLYYHEVGDESYQVLDRAGAFVPLVDPITTAYRPNGRALNYRSEPFMNRLALQQRLTGRFDESLEYSSYGFGDPATPMLRGYLGDPVKQRVIHAGSEVFHVHHVHGGSTRWLRQFSMELSRFATGLDKHPPVRPANSDRTDSQSLGPSEVFDVIGECGSGGCQQSAGDFMFHCHVTHHYFAGMWGIWRVYNTLQDGAASTDALPPLPALPDPARQMEPAVSSDALVGRTISSYGVSTTIGAGDLTAWVERQLPPRGVPNGYDASVFDWAREGDVYLNEPETEAEWPAYRARAPGARPPLLFDPRTGKLAYPFLRPHLGKRPPFAPNHGPAPFLDPARSGAEVPLPGEHGPGSICPEGTRPRAFAINAVALPVPLNISQNIVDPAGQLFVVRAEREAVLADPKLRVPLAVRANGSQDCVDVLLRSELEDRPEDPFSKVSAHIHFVQFDVQASDGVNTGFNYEQTVRPFRLEGEVLTAPATAGDTRLRMGGTGRFQVESLIGVGMDRDKEFEVRRIAAVEGDAVVLDTPLAHGHAAGEWVSAEFVRYRWYPDVQFGTAFFHDHVNVIHSSRHGLFGALVAEPPGSTYRHPRTGEELVSGIVADIHTDAVLSPDVTGSFREVVMFIQDDVPLNQTGRSTGSAFNLRAEPPQRRGRDPALAFSSQGGDPETPLLESVLGDPIVVRTLVAANNEVHSWHVDGHWFRREPYSLRSPPTNTVDIGISERFDLVIPRAGGPQAMPGDYLYYSGRTFKLREGSWGLLRVHESAPRAGLRPLPGREQPPTPARDVCPSGAPAARFAVAAVEAPLPMLGGSTGKVFVLEPAVADVVAGRKRPEPLVLHVRVGDCITVALSNRTADGPVSLHADLLAFDPSDSAGVAAGREPVQAVPPGATRTFTYYASPEVGETVSLLRDWGDVLRNPGKGLYGAIVVGPSGASYRGSGWAVDVFPPGRPPYREFTLFFQDEDEAIGNHRMPYATDVRGAVGVNYQVAPLDARLAVDPDPARLFDGGRHGDPPTPVLHAFAGDPVRLNVLTPWSEQTQVFSVEGHRWATTPGLAGTSLVGSVQLGGLAAITVDLEGGAGGPRHLPGDYLYGDHREPYRQAGLWGLLRVLPGDADPPPGLLPLERAGGTTGAVRVALAVGIAVVGVLAVEVVMRRRRD